LINEKTHDQIDYLKTNLMIKMTNKRDIHR